MIQREPILTTGAVVSAVTAALSLAASFGLNLSEDQRTAILGVVPFIVAGVTWALARRKTSPAAEVAAQKINGQVVAGPASAISDGTPVKVEPQHGETVNH